MEMLLLVALLGGGLGALIWANGGGQDAQRPDDDSGIGPSPVDERARNLVPAAGIVATVLHQAVETTLGIPVDFSRWRFFATVAGVDVGMANLSARTSPAEFSRFEAVIHEKLQAQHGADANRAISDCRTLWAGSSKHGLDAQAASVGFWVLTNALGRKLVDREFRAAHGVGSTIVREIKGYTD